MRLEFLFFVSLIAGVFCAEAAPAQGRPPTDAPVVFESTDTSRVRDAGRKALGQWVRDFPGREMAGRRVAVLPLASDLKDGYMTETLRHALAIGADAPIAGVFARDNAVCEQLLAEIRRGERMGDAMEASTIQRFGRVSGVDLIVVGRIAGVVTDPEWESVWLRRVLGKTRTLSVRVVASVYEIETGRLWWGGERTGVVEYPEEPWRIPGSYHWWLGAGGAGMVLVVLLLGGIVWVRGRYRPL